MYEKLIYKARGGFMRGDVMRWFKRRKREARCLLNELHRDMGALGLCRRRFPLLRLLAVAVAAALTLLILVVAVAAISSESLAAILTKGLEGFVEYLKYNFEGFKEYLAWLLEILRELA